MATVLLVDDDRHHLALFSRLLRNRGHRSFTAVVGSNNVDLHTHEPVDIVLMDYRLNSSLTALQVVRIIKDSYPDIPVVLVSGVDSMPDDMKAHVKTFINKDDPDRLIATLEELTSHPNQRTA